MSPNLLVLGGTTEARALCVRLADAGFQGVLSLAGRVARPKDQALPTRVGGFGGIDGLSAFLKVNNVTHVIDATHPFASQMSQNAVAACTKTSTPLIALTRPPWRAQKGDTWVHVPNIAGAVAALNGAPRRVFLAVGRMHLAAFATQPQHHFVLRLVDPPEVPPPLPDHHAIIARGPFTEAADLALLQEHRIDVVVSKNAGGSAAVSKITAARTLNLPVIMIDRPPLPDRQEVHDIDVVMDWLTHADLGV